MIIGDFDWTTAGTILFSFITAGATVVLAFATWKAVKDSRRTADAALESATAAKDSAQSARDSVTELAASVAATEQQTRQARLPVLTPADPNEVPVSVTNMGVTCRLILRNDGYGPAVIVMPTATDGGIQVPQDISWQRGSVSAQVVPPGGEVELRGDHPGQPQFGRLYLRVAYTDVLGEQRTTTYIHIENRQSVWNVTGTAHKSEDGPLKPWGDGWNTEWLAREGLS